MRLVWTTLALACLAVPSRAAACAPCGAGDATLTSVGASAPFAGRTRVSLIARELELGVRDASIVERRLSLALAVSPTDWLTLIAGAPIVWRELWHANLAYESGVGLGDAELRGQFLLVRAPGAPDHMFFAELGARVPTTTTLTDSRGAPLSLDAQPGSGSFDPSVGLRWHVLAGELAAFTSVTAHFPTEGLGGYRAGTSVQASITGQWQPVARVAFVVGVDARGEDAARARVGELAEGGGFVAFASGGLMVSPLDGVILSAVARAPIVDALRGSAWEGRIVELGAIVDAI